jgi:hypothetical protein
MSIQNFNHKIYNNIISKNIPNKQLLRGNTSIDSNLSITNLDKLSQNTCNNFVYYNLYNFKHKRSNNIELQIYLTTNPFLKKKISSDFLSNLKSLNNTKKKSLNLVQAVKGGFLATHKNITGFIPGSHVLKSIRMFNNYNKNKSIEQDLYLSNLHESNKYIYPKLNFRSCKINFLPQQIKKNFVSAKRKKSESKINFVFLTK